MEIREKIKQVLKERMETVGRLSSSLSPGDTEHHTHFYNINDEGDGFTTFDNNHRHFIRNFMVLNHQTDGHSHDIIEPPKTMSGNN